MSDQTPFGAFYFTVEIFGESIAYPFRSCSGLRTESTVIELKEGGRDQPRKLVGDVKASNLVLKRGFCGASSELYKLRERFLNYRPAKASTAKGYQTPNRFSGVITQLGPNGKRARWRFIQAWICKWEGPDFDAGKNEISIESVEIAHEGLEMLTEPAPGPQS